MDIGTCPARLSPTPHFFIDAILLPGKKMMKITEIFASIQGESTLQGFPCVFVRLTGCNLACRYCDTPYAREGGVEMTVDEIAGRVVSFHIDHVCITGGEPLLQDETPMLAKTLAGLGLTMSVETNGTLDVSALPEGVRRIIDVKCPGSGESDRLHPSVLSGARPGDEFKFVLTGRDDFDFAVGFARSHALAERGAVLLSPAAGFIEPSLLADWIVREAPDTRLNLQIHRYIWPRESRGR